MRDATFTQLTISVQGKPGSGQSLFAEEIVMRAAQALGGSATLKKNDKAIAVVACELPLAALPALEDGLFVFTRRIQAALVVPASPAPELVALSAETMKALGHLLRRRDVAMASLADGSASIFISGPKFVPLASLEALLVESATQELLEIDSTLKHMGFRFVVAEKS